MEDLVTKESNLENKVIADVAKVEFSQFNLQESQANDIVRGLDVFINERKDFIKQYEDVVRMDITHPQSWALARELRLRIRDNRTKGIEVWHKAEKEYFLRGGQFVDAKKRAEVIINEKMESDLLEIEKYPEIIEKQRKDSLRAERISQLEKYSKFVPMGLDFGEINEEEFLKVKNGAVLQYNQEQELIAKREAEAAEAKRIEQLRWNRAELIKPFYKFFKDDGSVNLGEISQDEFDNILNSLKTQQEAEDRRIADLEAENARIKKEAEIKAKKISDRAILLSPYLEFVSDYDEFINLSDLEFNDNLESMKKEADRIAKLNAEEEAKREAALKAKLKKEAEAKAKKDAEGKAARAAKEKAEKEAAEKAEREERERLEAEAKAKAPLKEQLTEWVNSFNAPPFATANKTSDLILEKFEAFKSWALTRIDEL